MIEFSCDDTLWEKALDWIMREQQEAFDQSAARELSLWLAENPAHQKAYNQARTLWLATGLVPTKGEQEDSSRDKG